MRFRCLSAPVFPFRREIHDASPFEDVHRRSRPSPECLGAAPCALQGNSCGKQVRVPGLQQSAAHGLSPEAIGTGRGPDVSYTIQLSTRSRYTDSNWRHPASNRRRTTSGWTMCPPCATRADTRASASVTSGKRRKMSLTWILGSRCQHGIAAPQTGVSVLYMATCQFVRSPKPIPIFGIPQHAARCSP